MTMMVPDACSQHTLHGGFEFGECCGELLGGCFARLPEGLVGRPDSGDVGREGRFAGGGRTAWSRWSSGSGRTTAVVVMVAEVPVMTAMRWGTDAVQLCARSCDGLLTGFEGGEVGATRGRVGRGKRVAGGLEGLNLGFIQFAVVHAVCEQAVRTVPTQWRMDLSTEPLGATGATCEVTTLATAHEVTVPVTATITAVRKRDDGNRDGGHDATHSKRQQNSAQ